MWGWRLNCFGLGFHWASLRFAAVRLAVTSHQASAAASAVPSSHQGSSFAVLLSGCLHALRAGHLLLSWAHANDAPNLCCGSVTNLHDAHTVNSESRDRDGDEEVQTWTGTCRQTVNLTDCCTMGTTGSCLTYCCGIWNHLSRSTCTSQHLAKPRICPSSRFSFSLPLFLLKSSNPRNIHNFENLHPPHPAQDKHLMWETHVNDSKDNTARQPDIQT